MHLTVVIGHLVQLVLRHLDSAHVGDERAARGDDHDLLVVDPNRRWRSSLIAAESPGRASTTLVTRLCVNCGDIDREDERAGEPQRVAERPGDRWRKPGDDVGNPQLHPHLRATGGRRREQLAHARRSRAAGQREVELAVPAGDVDEVPRRGGGAQVVGDAGERSRTADQVLDGRARRRRPQVQLGIRQQEEAVSGRALGSRLHDVAADAEGQRACREREHGGVVGVGEAERGRAPEPVGQRQPGVEDRLRERDR